ncbi:hypothetical protein GCM10007857_89850 [Bradyrhizobium iriomotense]|uniref:Uncharacterized protein n=1 Tax=Bradyrhizobium iriomotense TaxID=441950 RepID=A0ABQ6BDX6_9BRAD|nr:hypothetical protein GCM10007857_89850 [Bradyrhizobium iriomotense]
MGVAVQLDWKARLRIFYNRHQVVRALSAAMSIETAVNRRMLVQPENWEAT